MRCASTPAPPEGAHRWDLLLVEDDPDLREVVVQILTDAGYRAHGAPDGAAALARLGRPGAPPVGAVLLDLRLPDMDGAAFAAAYRRLPGPPAPLLLFTAVPPAEAAAAAARVGAAGGGAGAGRQRATDARRRQLARLRDEVARVRAATARVRAAVRALAAAEATRALTPAEARRVSALRREGAALRLELTLFGAEFERLRAAGRGAKDRPRRP
jgi:CheY-like chemotaxis protein